MEKWYLCKVKYEKYDENGILKKVNELYALRAYSFTDAEAKIIEQITPFVSGEYEIDAITKKNYSELVGTNGDRWFECKLNYLVLDDVRSKVKKMPVFMLVNSDTTGDANDEIILFMKSTMIDYEIEKVVETKILDVFK